MSEQLKITLIKEEMIKRLKSVSNLSAQMGYFVHFEEDNSPLLAVLQADVEKPAEKQKIKQQVATRHFHLVLGVRVAADIARCDTQRDQLLVDAVNALFTELSNPLNRLATAFTREGEVTFGLTESNKYLTAVIPLQVTFLQITP